MFLEVSEVVPIELEKKVEEASNESNNKSSKKSVKKEEDSKKEKSFAEKKEEEDGKKEGEKDDAIIEHDAIKQGLLIEPLELRFNAKGGLQKLNVSNNTDNRLVVKVMNGN